MSKVVKGIGRAVGSVINGVVKAVKSVATSGFGKLVLGAGLMYFGAPVISGAVRGFSEGGLSGALSGAGSGFSSAWDGLTSGVSKALSGDFSGAGTSLWEGMTGPSDAGKTAGLADTIGAPTQSASDGFNGVSDASKAWAAPDANSLPAATAAAGTVTPIPQTVVPQTGIMGGASRDGYNVGGESRNWANTAATTEAAPRKGGLMDWFASDPRAPSAALILGGNMLAATMAARARRQQEEDVRDRARANWSVGMINSNWKR